MNKKYKKRLIDELLYDYLTGFSAVLIEGAKAVGKTFTCEVVAKKKYQLDLDETREMLRLSPELIFNQEKPVLLDEWQHLPSIWNFVRHAVDDGLAEGSVLLTGSNPDLFSDLHSGAGRIGNLKMRPYSVEEREMETIQVRLSELLKAKVANFDHFEAKSGQLDYVDEIFRSGFPEIREKNPRFIEKYLQSYVDQTVTRDILENGFKVNKPAALLSWLRSYSAASATTTAYTTILQAASQNSGETANKNTATNYREILESIGMIEEVQPWLPIGKLFTNLGKTPKHFVVDPAFIPILLEFDLDKLTSGTVDNPIGKINKTMVGQLFESLIYQSLATYAEVNEAKITHFRNSNGSREIDFIIQKKRKIVAVEVKATNIINDHDVRHLNWFEKTTQGEYEVTKVVLYMGKLGYQRLDNVLVIPASSFGA